MDGPIHALRDRGEGRGKTQSIPDSTLPTCPSKEIKKKITQTLSGIQHFNHFHSKRGQGRGTWSSREKVKGGRAEGLTQNEGGPCPSPSVPTSLVTLPDSGKWTF